MLRKTKLSPESLDKLRKQKDGKRPTACDDRRMKELRIQATGAEKAAAIAVNSK